MNPVDRITPDACATYMTNKADYLVPERPHWRLARRQCMADGVRSATQGRAPMQTEQQ